MPSNSSTCIEIEDLVKRFGSFTALDGLSMTVRSGEVHGFLGPNGAGKSTTIRVLLGLLRSDAGVVRLLGGDPWRDVISLHRRLAYVPGDVVLWPTLTGGEAIDLLGRLRGGLDETRRTELLERFELDPTKRGRSYSKGNRQKVALVAALASDVELLLLDEPTSGLDPLMEAVFQEEIAKEKARGRTILLSSHIMSEVEALADRISIIRNGRITETGTLHELRDHTRSSITAVLDRPPRDPAALTGFSEVRLEHDKLTGWVESSQLTTALEGLTACGIASLRVTPPSLEDLFLRHYQEPEDNARPSTGGARR